jgi:predicted phage tail protein
MASGSPPERWLCSPVCAGSEGRSLPLLRHGLLVAVSVASVAYSVYMSRNMKTKTSAEAAETNTLTNNSFTSAENRVGQGHPVPLLLGEMEVGSNVISSVSTQANNQDWTESIS